METDQWREILRELIIYGMLFKAVARDADNIDQAGLKLTYRQIMDSISIWAERKHHEYRRQFARLGGKIHLQETRDGFTYFVLVSIRGKQEESIYNVEILRAECQDRLNQYFRSSIK